MHVKDCVIKRGLSVVICRIVPLGIYLIDILVYLCIPLLQCFKKFVGISYWDAMVQYSSNSLINYQ